jgi:hypothetical protein
MHPDPHPPNTAPFTLREPSRPRRAWANLTRGSRPLILLATLGTLGGLAMLFAAWVLIMAGSALGFLAGVLLALLGIASLALAAATLADALEWRE